MKYSARPSKMTGTASLTIAGDPFDPNYRPGPKYGADAALSTIYPQTGLNDLSQAYLVDEPSYTNDNSPQL